MDIFETGGNSPDARLIDLCDSYVACVEAYESLLDADVDETRPPELVQIEESRNRAASLISEMEPTTWEGICALAAAIDIETRDDYMIQGRAVEWIDILLRGILGNDKLASTVQPTMTAEEQAAAYGTAGRFEDANGNCLKTVSCANCASPCTEFLSRFSPHRLVTAD